MRMWILVIIVLLAAPSLSANDAWVSFGAGAGSEGLVGFSSGALQVSRHFVLGARYIEMINPDKVGDSFGSFYEGARDIGFLLGFVHSTTERHSISLSAGYGMVMITEKGDWVDGWLFTSGSYEKEQTNTGGLLFQCDAFFGNFGIQAFVDINDVKPFGGLVLSWRTLTSI